MAPNFKFKILNSGPGFIFLEVIVAMALLGIVFVFLLGVGTSVLGISKSIQKELAADSLLKESMESLRSFKNSTEWPVDGLGAVNYGEENPYSLILEENESGQLVWQLVLGPDQAGGFSRKIIFDKVSRQATSGDIEPVYNASNNDEDTVKATVVVYDDLKQYRISAYFTNWLIVE